MKSRHVTHPAGHMVSSVQLVPGTSVRGAQRSEMTSGVRQLSSGRGDNTIRLGLTDEEKTAMLDRISKHRLEAVVGSSTARIPSPAQSPLTPQVCHDHALETSLTRMERGLRRARARLGLSRAPPATDAPPWHHGEPPPPVPWRAAASQPLLVPSAAAAGAWGVRQTALRRVSENRALLTTPKRTSATRRVSAARHLPQASLPSSSGPCCVSISSSTSLVSQSLSVSGFPSVSSNCSVSLSEQSSAPNHPSSLLACDSEVIDKICQPASQIKQIDASSSRRTIQLILPQEGSSKDTPRQSPQQSPVAFGSRTSLIGSQDSVARRTGCGGSRGPRVGSSSFEVGSRVLGAKQRRRLADLEMGSITVSLPSSGRRNSPRHRTAKSLAGKHSPPPLAATTGATSLNAALTGSTTSLPCQPSTSAFTSLETDSGIKAAASLRHGNDRSSSKFLASVASEERDATNQTATERRLAIAAVDEIGRRVAALPPRKRPGKYARLPKEIEAMCRVKLDEWQERGAGGEPPESARQEIEFTAKRANMAMMTSPRRKSDVSLGEGNGETSLDNCVMALSVGDEYPLSRTSSRCNSSTSVAMQPNHTVISTSECATMTSQQPQRKASNVTPSQAPRDREALSFTERLLLRRLRGQSKQWAGSLQELHQSTERRRSRMRDTDRGLITRL